MSAAPSVSPESQWFDFEDRLNPKEEAFNKFLCDSFCRSDEGFRTIGNVTVEYYSSGKTLYCHKGGNTVEKLLYFGAHIAEPMFIRLKGDWDEDFQVMKKIQGTDTTAIMNTRFELKQVCYIY